MFYRAKVSLETAMLMAADRNESRKIRNELTTILRRNNVAKRESLLLEDVIAMNQKAIVAEREAKAEAVQKLIREAEEKKAKASENEVHIHTYIHTHK